MIWGILLSSFIMVNRGLNSIRNLMASGTGDANTPPTIGVVGSAAFTPAAGDTSLTGSFYGDLFDINTVSDKRNEYELLLAANEGNATIYSVGIFNDGGELFAEDTFTPVTKTGSMEVQFDINISYTDV